MLPLLEHRYVAEILRDGAAPVTTGELHPDWVPALEWGYLQSLRKQGEARTAMPGLGHISPAWDRDAGAPYVSHVDVRLDRPGAGAARIPLAYFTSVVQRAVAELVAHGTVAEGDEYQWRICAYPAARARPAEPAEPSFEVEEMADGARPTRSCALAALLGRARHHGPRSEQADRLDMPVLFAPHVLQEASAAAIAAGPLEAGGILLGSLARDADEGELVLQVLAQVPAREAIGEDASLRFTADTWKAVHAAIRLRGDEEQILGWWHSHPAALWICRNCPPQRRAVCPSNRPFFSSMDVAFHRTAFQPAHHVALLLSFLADPAPRFDLFGWRRGMVCQRGYYTLEAHP
jgi:hypothetical protein